MSKEKKFKITADQLMQLENGFTLPKLKEWFPKVFVKKLEVGKWYKKRDKVWNLFLFCFSGTYGNESSYGFNASGKWSEMLGVHNSDEYVAATEQEVFEALKNELVKRGVSFGKSLRFVKDENCMIDGEIGEGGLKLFRDGVFIKTKTRQQEEQELNCKIID